MIQLTTVVVVCTMLLAATSLDDLVNGVEAEQLLFQRAVTSLVFETRWTLTSLMYCHELLKIFFSLKLCRLSNIKL